MGLSLRAALAARGFAVDIEIEGGEHVAVLGPNGAGKSTLLGILAGTLRPDNGHAVLDGDTLFDLDAGHHRWRPPHARGIALLAQEPLLFPHLSVRDNVAFGPSVAGTPRAKARAIAERWLDEVEALDLAERRPGELSGGQAQRVAIARALATEPKLLLLDEPMAALDVSVAPLLRRVLRRVLAGRTAMIVTHDLMDALLLGDRVVVLEQGMVADSGPAADVLAHPKAAFAAHLAGLNLITGTFADGAVVGPGGLLLSGVHGEGEGPAEGEPAAAAFSPADVSIHTVRPGGSPRNVWAAVVAELEPRGELVRVRSDDRHGGVVAADVTPGSIAELDLYPGREVILAVKAAAVRIYPA
jgi:molybdate transport system ATP-binding protein